jgi:hypothetical protein
VTESNIKGRREETYSYETKTDADVSCEVMRETRSCRKV